MKTTFKITIETMSSSYQETNTSKTIEVVECVTLEEAKKAKKELIKKHNLIKHAGHIVNYKSFVELITNF